MPAAGEIFEDFCTYMAYVHGLIDSTAELNDYLLSKSLNHVIRQFDLITH